MKPEEAIEIIEKQIITCEAMIEFNENFDPEEDNTKFLKEKEALLMAAQSIREVQQYREIGTVEECREAVEKQTQKKCAIDSCPDHTHYKCPSCGQIELSIYKHGFPRLGRITKYCENCGQALIDEN